MAMPGVSRLFVDTNLLVYATSADSPWQSVAEQDSKMLQQFSVRGRQVHDANIVPTMRIHGVKDLLTHNTGDFTRFAALITVHPLVLVPQSGAAQS
jgi:predicted nucleic acid-binding protein